MGEIQGIKSKNRNIQGKIVGGSGKRKLATKKILKTTVSNKIPERNNKQIAKKKEIKTAKEKYGEHYPIVTGAFLILVGLFFLGSLRIIPYISQQKQFLIAILIIIFGAIAFLLDDGFPFKSKITDKKQANGKNQKKSLIIVFVIMLILFLTLRVSFSKWSGDYVNFHSGEKEFYDLINSFSDGNTAVVAQKEQSVMVYFFGSIAFIFKHLGIFSLSALRIVMDVISLVNMMFLLLIAKKMFEKNRYKNEIMFVSLFLFGFSYFLIFYSNLIRPDTIIILLFSMFFYLTIAKEKPNFIALSFIAGLALAFKGNGLILFLFVPCLYLFVLAKPYKAISKVFKWKTVLNLTILVSTSLLTYMILTPFVGMSLLSMISHFLGGFAHISGGHYGLFPTNIQVPEIIGSRFSLLLWAFSPLFLFMFLGIFYYLKLKIKTAKTKKDIKYVINEKIVLVILSVIFFLYIFSQPIQFGRYYFPTIEIFIIFAAYGMVKSLRKWKAIIVILLVLFLIFNISFYSQMLNNSRFEAKNKLDPYAGKIVVPADTKGWTYPPSEQRRKAYSNLSEIPDGYYLLVSGQYYYKFEKYLKEPEKYTESGWYPFEAVPYEQIRLFEQIIAAEPDMKIERKNFFFFENRDVPYDIWYMTHPNYYLYSANEFK